MICQWLPSFSNFAPVSHKRNVEEHVPSKNGCTWGGFKYCVISRVDGPSVLSRKTLMSSGVTELARSNSAVHSICPSTWCTRSNMPFACGLLTLVGLHLIPYDSYRYLKCSLNSLPLLYFKWQHRGHLHNQVLFTNLAKRFEVLSKISSAINSSFTVDFLSV